MTQQKQISLSRLLFGYSSEEARYSAELSSAIHVSDLFNLCPREYYLVRKLGVKKDRIVAPGTRLNWEMGKAMEKVIVGWLVAMGVAEDSQVVLTQEKLNIVGHADIRLKNGGLVEVKAKDPVLFRMTKYKPLPHDLFQLQTYLWMDKTKTGTLLTITWGQERVPFRDMEVHYNLQVPELIKKIVSPIREAETGGKLPPRVCGSRQDRRALTCPVADTCFAQPGERIKTIGEMIGG